LAGRALRFPLRRALVERGVRLATLTHAAGLSSSGDPELDAMLPLPERYELPAATASAALETRAAGGRVIACGTSVVRALEGCAAAHGGALVAERAVTDLVIRAPHRLCVVDGLVSGVHAPDSSHFALLSAFLSPALLARYTNLVRVGGYRGHEFGDSTLILPGQNIF
jgi:S-adenosylmethionine:tRNA ribosyltransferase-isomerase